MSAPTPAPDPLVELYKAAGEPLRLRLLQLLAHGERCVCHLHDALEVPQPTVSRHLAILRRAGLVRGRRDGAWVHYTLTEAAETWLAPALAQWRSTPDPTTLPPTCG